MKIIIILLVFLNIEMQSFAAETQKITATLFSKNSKYIIKITSSKKIKKISLPKKYLEFNTLYESFDVYITVEDYHKNITAFQVAPGYIGLYLSAYRISKGSVKLAYGTDKFLIYDEKKNKIINSAIKFKVSKARVKHRQCMSAIYHRFIVSDINRDGMFDVGIIKEEIICNETANVLNVSHKDPFYIQEKIKWFVFKDQGWIYNKKLDKRFPDSYYFYLPLLGMAKTPIDFVKEFNLSRKK